MKGKYKNCIVVFCITFSSLSNAQYRELRIGDIVPNIELSQISNYKTKKARLYDFKNDLLILDFWATWCRPCIGMFPKTDSLQKKFKDRVKFLPISSESYKKVNDFLRSMNIVKRISIPSVAEDDVLSRFFPYSTIPHYVWIDKKGIVIGITEKNEVTEYNIDQIIKGMATNIKMKAESRRSMNIMQSAFNEFCTIIYNDDTTNKKSETLSRDRLFYRSVFSRSIPGIHGFSHFEPHSYTSINTSPLLLLREYWGLKKIYGYNYNTFLAEGRTVMQVKDTMTVYKLSGGYLNDLHSGSAWKEWAEKYAVCYELVVPDSMSIERKEQLMEQDLRRYFHDIYKVQFDIEKKIVKQLILKRTSSDDKIRTKGGTPEEDYNEYSINIKNVPFENFVRKLKEIYRGTYTVSDETNFIGNIDLELITTILDYNALNKELKKHDLQLILDEKEMDVLVIKDSD